MTAFLAGIGPMRIALLAITAFLIACAPFAGTGPVYAGWQFVPTVLAPVLAPIMLFVLPLEMTMSRLFMADEGEAGKQRYRRIIRIELFGFALLVLSWLPYLVRLWNASRID